MSARHKEPAAGRSACGDGSGSRQLRSVKEDFVKGIEGVVNELRFLSESPVIKVEEAGSLSQAESLFGHWHTVVLSTGLFYHASGASGKRLCVCICGNVAAQ